MWPQQGDAVKDNQLADQSCPVCGGMDSRIFFELQQVPVLIGVLWPSREEAQDCPKGDVQLQFCPDCGFIHNRRFDETLTRYSQSYNNSLHYSPVYDAYAQATAQRIIENYEVTGKTVLEIGCGKGDFLSMLCRFGDNRGIGFDQSYEKRPGDPELDERLTFVNDLYGPRYSSYRADLVCSRYVLEHIPRPVEFMKMLRTTLATDSSPLLYFEVPNAGLILSDLSIWDIIYEHCSYFSKASLNRVFEAAGFTVLNIQEAFGGQFISLAARPFSAGSNDLTGRGEKSSTLEDEVARFPDQYRGVLAQWRETLHQLAGPDRKTVLWGGGAKGVSFLNLLKDEQQIEYVVDINPAKQGKYLPGSGQRVVAPQFLQKYRPQTVLLLNPAYREEVRDMLNELGLELQILCP